MEDDEKGQKRVVTVRADRTNDRHGTCLHRYMQNIDDVGNLTEQEKLERKKERG